MIAFVSEYISIEYVFTYISLYLLISFHRFLFHFHLVILHKRIIKIIRLVINHPIIYGEILKERLFVSILFRDMRKFELKIDVFTPLIPIQNHITLQNKGPGVCWVYSYVLNKNF